MLDLYMGKDHERKGHRPKTIELGRSQVVTLALPIFVRSQALQNQNERNQFSSKRKNKAYNPDHAS
jgi:hypothetical protein